MLIWDDFLGCVGPGVDVFSTEGLGLDLIFHLVSIKDSNTRTEIRNYYSRR